MIARSGLILITGLITALVLFGALWFFKGILKGNKIQKIFNIINFVCIGVMVASWIINIGWFRVILTFSGFPFFHIGIFAFAICFALKKDCSKITMVLAALAQATFVITYVLFPDGGDFGSAYLFFGLIHNDEIASIGFWGAFFAFCVHVVLLIALIVRGFMAKEKKQEEIES